MNEQINEIRTRITTPKLSMNRVPLPTYKRFTELSNEQFCSDYGQCLGYLIRFHDGIVVSGVDKVMVEIRMLEQRIAKLEEELLDKQLNKKTRLNGEKR